MGEAVREYAPNLTPLAYFKAGRSSPRILLLLFCSRCEELTGFAAAAAPLAGSVLSAAGSPRQHLRHIVILAKEGEIGQAKHSSGLEESPMEVVLLKYQVSISVASAILLRARK